MLIKVKEAIRLDEKLFSKPDYSHINDGNVQVSDAVFIPFNQIKIVTREGVENNDKSGTNRGRVEPFPSASRLTRIQNSFAPGIIQSEYLPAVIKRNVAPDEPLQYELVYGVGRVITFKEHFGAKGYWFNIITATETELEWVCLVENEELERTPNKERDVANAMVRMANNSAFKKSQFEVDKQIRKNLPFRRKESRIRIVGQVCEGANIPLTHITYTEEGAWEWIRTNSIVEYVIGGNLDPRNDKFGFLVKEGRIKDFFHKAIMHKAQTGKSSYGIFHYELPSEKSSFATKMQNQFEYLECL